jgi:hypothetical protein
MKKTSFYTQNKYKLLTIAVNATNNYCDFLKIIFCWGGGGARCEYLPRAPKEPSYATSKHIMLMKTIIKRVIIFLSECSK